MIIGAKKRCGAGPLCPPCGGCWNKLQPCFECDNSGSTEYFIPCENVGVGQGLIEVGTILLIGDVACFTVTDETVTSLPDDSIIVTGGDEFPNCVVCCCRYWKMIPCGCDEISLISQKWLGPYAVTQPGEVWRASDGSCWVSADEDQFGTHCRFDPGPGGELDVVAIESSCAECCCQWRKANKCSNDTQPGTPDVVWYPADAVNVSDVVQDTNGSCYIVSSDCEQTGSPAGTAASVIADCRDCCDTFWREYELCACHGGGGKCWISSADVQDGVAVINGQCYFATGAIDCATRAPGDECGIVDEWVSNCNSCCSCPSAETCFECPAMTAVVNMSIDISSSTNCISCENGTDVQCEAMGNIPLQPDFSQARCRFIHSGQSVQISTSCDGNCCPPCVGPGNPPLVVSARIECNANGPLYEYFYAATMGSPCTEGGALSCSCGTDEFGSQQPSGTEQIDPPPPECPPSHTVNVSESGSGWSVSGSIQFV